MENIKATLSKHGFTFKKAFGQNFITDTNLLKSIVIGAGITANDEVLEIGCGAGTLTYELSLSAKKVVGYEIDNNLAPILFETVGERENVEIFYEDIMKSTMLEIESKFSGEYTVVANLPYYITTPIIMRFIEKSEKAKSLVIMVQEEVAERIIAKENTAEYGAITSAIRVVGNSRIIKKVPKTMFMPIPKVDSAVVKIDIDRNKFAVKSMEMYKSVLRAAFNNRRKMLVNNLMQSFNFTREETEKLLIKANLSLTARGEVLSTEQFVELSNIIVGEKNEKANSTSVGE